MKVGSQYLGENRCEFRVWAPMRSQVAVQVLSGDKRVISLSPEKNGYWHGILEGVSPNTRYQYLLDGELERPDPASHFQPQGVHGPSQVIDHSNFTWEDSQWRGLALEEYIIYELHVGTFTPEGTFTAIIPRLMELKSLGVNALEIMPVAQFPGTRNWGYDGTYLYGVQNSYGGVEGLKTLVNACHKVGMAVILDVVYNHFGPEGNYLWAYGPYFTDTYQTPWGDAVNYDQAYCNEVRNFFIENALYWFELYHIDALRLDAVHAIYDLSAQPFLQELGEATDSYSLTAQFPRYLIAESDLNDVRVLQSRETGGFGHASQWCDDFHHALHTLLTGEQDGYYQDFGAIEQLATSMQQGYIYTGQYSVNRQRNHGNFPRNCDGSNFVVCSQNHDQIGNRLIGERLANLVNFEGLKLAAGTVLLSPFIPMLFMGEEYGEASPFMYFVSHSDPDLVAGVRQGRKEEFQGFGWKEEDIPDPQGTKVFEESVLRWEKQESGMYRELRSLYQTLIQLRKDNPALASRDLSQLDATPHPEHPVLFLHRHHSEAAIFAIFNYKQDKVSVSLPLPMGIWNKILDSSDSQWGGQGSDLAPQLSSNVTITLNPSSFVVYSNT
ncbi:malto-oligosyltrehalose trehalohydrolase [Spirulina sp. CS-785/01]|uniref:malto-oligosyltrehalose trehalohydrolase n=1 Tax=Spirulina sp. CS-785/01 TaxID=3021716 RepID=UPI0023309C3C|nr:malto-oligosyltrehalose trehalohydrolase [Spirulina sp. CS-785/01]MDB9314241.1 malto-oligosyltrehalose trehalohydrolase [Spirulina sp. CS-785/01]